MIRARKLVLATLLGFAGCVGSNFAPAPATPAATTAPPVAESTPPAAPPAASTPAPAQAYSGHGAASISPAVLEQFRPKPIDPGVSRRIQALLDLTGPTTGRVSPDGKSLYFNWKVTGVPQVWKVNGARTFPTQLTGGEDSTLLVGITPDGKQLVIERDRKGEENPGLYLQDPNGGPLLLIQHVPGVRTQAQALSNDARWLYFRANDLKPDSYAIYKLDLASKELTKSKVFAQDGLWAVADVADDGRLLLQKDTGGTSQEFFEWDPAKSVLTPLFGQGEREEYEAKYGAKAGELLVHTNKGTEFRRLYSRVDGKLTPITPELAFDVDTWSIDRKKTRILYETNEGGYTRLHALDARTYKPIALPALPDADHVRAGATTPDGRFSTIGIDDGKHPLQAYVIDWKKRSLEKWNAPSTPEIDTTSFARATLDTYPARDGTKIPVLVRRPPSCAAASAPCPVVVSFHGGPEGQARPGFNVMSQMFVDAGFVFVEPNVRGSDGYGKTWFHADDGAKRLNIITDIEDASKWARTTFAAGGVAPKVGVLGGSYGGYSVLMGMTMFAGAYDAGVDIVGISNLSTFLLNTAPYRRILRISEYGDPEQDRDALSKLSPMTYIERVKAPLLIIQGASDPRVPAGEAIQIHDALATRSIPTDLIIFPDEGHGAEKRENRVIQFGAAIAFFQKYLR